MSDKIIKKKGLLITENAHREAKKLAAELGVSIQLFVSDLILKAAVQSLIAETTKAANEPRTISQVYE